MPTARQGTTGPPPRVRGWVVALALAGGAWGVLAALGGLELIGRGPLMPVEGRAGTVAGAAALVLAVCALAAAAAALRSSAVACALLFTASFGGVLTVGAAWLGPGAVMLLGSALALWAVQDPFAAEVARERAEGRGAHGRL